MRLAGLAVLAIARAAHGEPVEATEHAALRDVLGEAAAIVRGSAGETTRNGAFADTQFAVTDTLRGDVQSQTIVVREPADAEPFERGDDVILLLDVRTADGMYPVHHPAGRYRIDGADSVIVNASGVDGATVSAKDLRPRAPDERIPLDQFRVLAGGTPALRHDAARSPRAPIAARDAPRDGDRSTTQAADDASPTRWPWLLVAAVVAALIYGVRRAR